MLGRPTSGRADRMKEFILQRFLLMVVVLLAVSMVSFIIMELPPGSFRRCAFSLRNSS